MPRQQQRSMAVVGQVVATSYQGPIPLPGHLREYDELVPGSAKQIMDLFEAQSRHRMAMESHVIRSDVRRSWTGLVLGFVVAMSVVACGTWMIAIGHDWAGGSMITTGLGSIVGVFVYGSRSQRQERVQKAQIIGNRH
jgi:uncharacterized membrane protein